MPQYVFKLFRLTPLLPVLRGVATGRRSGSYKRTLCPPSLCRCNLSPRPASCPSPPRPGTEVEVLPEVDKGAIREVRKVQEVDRPVLAIPCPRAPMGQRGRGREGVRSPDDGPTSPAPRGRSGANRPGRSPVTRLLTPLEPDSEASRLGHKKPRVLGHRGPTRHRGSSGVGRGVRDPVGP